MRYTKKEYLKYKKAVEKAHKLDGVKPISYKMWKVTQPIADSIVGKANKIIKRQSINL